MIRVYTSATKSYLPKARVLANSLKAQHPEFWFSLMLSDSLPPGFDLADEPFDEVITIQQLGIDDLARWMFKHNVVELCTAVKGTALLRLLTMDDTDAVFYLDPDVLVLNSLQPLLDLLGEHDVLLTPHLLHPEDDVELIEGNEVVTTLAHGIFNLGFVGVKAGGEGIRFAKWWAKRLLHFCYDDLARGLFTDQRWCDFVPVFFPTTHIVRDIGCNVATWNILYRPVSREGNTYYAGGAPLRFYHFTGIDAGRNSELLERFAKGYPAAFELWADYREQLARQGQNDPALKQWEYGCFTNGVAIPDKVRRVYRDNRDLQNKYTDPYACADDDSFYSWCKYVDLLEEDIENWNPEVVMLEKELETVKGLIAMHEEHITILKEQIDAIHRSISWRVTEPLRWLKSKLTRQ